MTSVNAHGDLCIFTGKAPSALCRGISVGIRRGSISTHREPAPIPGLFLFDSQSDTPRLPAQPGPSWELRLGGRCAWEPGAALGWVGSPAGCGGTWETVPVALEGTAPEPSRGGPPRWAPPAWPPGHSGVKPSHASALEPGAIAFKDICLWSEVVTDQGYRDLDFSLTLTIIAAPGTHFLCSHLLTRPNTGLSCHPFACAVLLRPRPPPGQPHSWWLRAPTAAAARIQPSPACRFLHVPGGVGRGADGGDGAVGAGKGQKDNFSSTPRPAVSWVRRIPQGGPLRPPPVTCHCDPIHPHVQVPQVPAQSAPAPARAGERQGRCGRAACPGWAVAWPPFGLGLCGPRGQRWPQARRTHRPGELPPAAPASARAGPVPGGRWRLSLRSDTWGGGVCTPPQQDGGGLSLT